MRKLQLLLLIAIIASCSTYKALTPTSTQIAWAQKQWPGTTPEDLDHGKIITQKKCERCHSLKRLFARTDAELEKSVPVMAKKAHLNAVQEDLVMKYLKTANHQ